MSLLRYTLFRLALAVPVLLAILAVTFVITHALPTDPAVQAAGPLATAEQVVAKRQELGLDQSLGWQFVHYFGDVFTGDLGRSVFTSRPAIDEIGERLMPTLTLITAASFLAFVLGIGVALLAADRRSGPRDWLARTFGTVGTAIPDYFLGLILIFVLYTQLHIFPEPVGQAGTVPPDIAVHTHSYFIDAVIAGNGSAVWAAFQHAVLPVATLAVIYAAPIYRVARAAIEETRRAAYVDYVTMMGGSSRLVWRYAIENAVPPILTITGIVYGVLLGGALLVENVFAWGGIGQYAVDAVKKSDYFPIQDFVLVAAVFSVAVYIVVDLLHAALDPRVRKAL